MTYLIVQPRNRWEKVEPAAPFWREYLARRNDGELRLILVASSDLEPGMAIAA